MSIKNIRDLKDFTKIPGIRIDRLTKWGNPFVMFHEGMRDEVCDKYKDYLWKKIQDGEIALSDLAELAGQDLYCWCAPKRCHGDTLMKAAEWAKKKLEDKNNGAAIL